MVKNRNNFSESTIQLVWEKAIIVIGYDPRNIRKDANGAWIHRNMYGNTSSDCNAGWEIDHINPISNGGSNYLFNLQPLQWKNNRSKGSDYPNWDYSVTAA